MITVRGLRKDYSGTTAVQDLDLDAAPGEILGLLGPNGAGKTTTLRMLTTLLRPSAGRATIAGADLRADPAGVRRRIGSVAQGNSTDPNCAVAEEIVLQARLHGLPRARARARAAELAAEFELDLGHLTGRLSGGQRRRLDLALGLVHQPAVLFLDEPTVGLDPPGRAALWDRVRGVRDAGSTVVLSTHYLAEAEACCDRIVLISAGRAVADGTPEELKRAVGDDATLEDAFAALTSGAAR